MKKIKVSKKLAAIIVGVLIVAMGLPFFAAFEAHIINVRAHIENALSVCGTRDVLTTVFPNETNVKLARFKVSLSESFRAQRRVKDVSYIIRAKSKAHPQGTAEDGFDGKSATYWNNHNLSPWLRIAKVADNDTVADDTDADHSSNLDKNLGDYHDTWVVSIPWVPPFEGQRAQVDLVGEHANQYLPAPANNADGEDYGADIWIETTGFSYNNSYTDNN